MEQLFDLAERYPQLAAIVVSLVVWPTLTGLLSFAFHRLEERYPALVAMLRASGLDMPRTLEAIRAAWPKRLPKPPGPGMLLMLAFVFTGCGAQEQLVKFAEASRDVATYAEPCMLGALEVDLARCSTPECVAEVQHKWAAPMSTLDLVKQTWCAISASSEGCGK
jgi:hypothetical protein